MYAEITGEDPYRTPMRIYPAIHYTMGGLWVDYDLMSTIDGLFVAGEANFSDHGANRLGASALMQGLADGYFIVPLAVGSYLARARPPAIDASHPAFEAARKDTTSRIERLLSARGKRSAASFHRELGKLLWDTCGMSRNRAGLERALAQIPELRERFYRELLVPGQGESLNRELETAGRVADYFELGELICRDALHREESCGGHFREEYQTPDGEALRDDEHFAYVAAWEWREGEPPVLHKEPLVFEAAPPMQRSYK